MGESRGGEGRAEGPTVIPMLSSIIRSYRSEGREIRDMSFKRLSEGLYSLEVHIHGEPEPDEILYFNEEDMGHTQNPAAFSRTSKGTSKG